MPRRSLLRPIGGPELPVCETANTRFVFSFFSIFLCASVLDPKMVTPAARPFGATRCFIVSPRVSSQKYKSCYRSTYNAVLDSPPQLPPCPHTPPLPTHVMSRVAFVFFALFASLFVALATPIPANLDKRVTHAGGRVRPFFILYISFFFFSHPCFRVLGSTSVCTSFFSRALLGSLLTLMSYIQASVIVAIQIVLASLSSPFPSPFTIATAAVTATK
jgi:hypothetical protein